MNVNKVLKSQYSTIPSDKYYEAIDLVNDATDKFNKIISGTDSTPTCRLVTKYEHDQAQKVSAKPQKTFGAHECHSSQFQKTMPLSWSG